MSEPLLSQDIDPTPMRRLLRGLFSNRRAAWLRRAATFSIVLAACITWSRVLAFVFIAVTLLFILARLYLAITAMRIFRRLFRPKRITVTPEGYLFVLVTVGVGAAAINTGYALLYLVFALLLSLIVTSGVVSELMTRKLSVIRNAPHAVFCGEHFEVTVSVKNKKRLFWAHGLRISEALVNPILRVEKEGYIAAVAPRKTATASVTLSAHKRGVLTLRGVLVETLFPFAFFKKRLAYEVTETVIVYPTILDVGLRIEAGARMRSLRKVPLYIRGEEDFRGLHVSRDGDNPRRIHWGLSAKHQKLLVREMDTKRADKLVVLFEPFLASERHKEEFEHAVSLAASLLFEAHRKGCETGLLTRTKRRTVTVFGTGKRVMLRQLEVLARVEPLPPRGDWVIHLNIRQAEGATLFVVSACPCAFAQKWQQHLKNFAVVKTIFGTSKDDP
ncbi:MAG: hypothetical protein DRP63_02910 [Planctomycetota bacterium]|nr:MAG: hypothetical protein DRP63_02910 [Planctomycetota bacterium]